MRPDSGCQYLQTSTIDHFASIDSVYTLVLGQFGVIRSHRSISLFGILALSISGKYVVIKGIQ